MGYRDFKELFLHICDIKKFVVKLSIEDLKNYKLVFYNQDFPQWRLDLLWEYIWNDKEYEMLKDIFQNQRLI